MTYKESNLDKSIDSTNFENSNVTMVSSNERHKKTEFEQLKEEIKNELRVEFNTILENEKNYILDEVYKILNPTKQAIGYLLHKSKYLNLDRHGKRVRDLIESENPFYLNNEEIKKFESKYQISKIKVSKKRTPSEIRKERLDGIYKLLVDRPEHFITTTEIVALYNIDARTSNRYFLELETTKNCVIFKDSKKKNVLTLFLDRPSCSTVPPKKQS